jgi:hypothetical protein
MAITISDVYLRQIKKVVAFPSIQELLFTDDEIKEFAVFPAMQDYFIKFPIKQRSQYATSGSTEAIFNFIDVNTYGVVDARVTDVGIVNGTGNSFLDLVYFQQLNGGALTGSGSGAYGIKGYNPSNMIQTRDMARAAYRSYQNTYSTLRYDVDVENRQVKIYSSVAGYINITWAKFSDNFEAIRYQRKFDVVKLAQAYMLAHFADTFDKLSDSALDMSINVEAIKTRSQELKTEVKELWDLFSDVIVLHSS